MSAESVRPKVKRPLLWLRYSGPGVAGVALTLKVRNALALGVKVPTPQTIFGGGVAITEPWLGIPTLTKARMFVRSIDRPDMTLMTFDLSAYAGQNVLIWFRYMTDQYTNWPGWYIESANLGGTPLQLTPIYPEADFMVTAVYAFVFKGHTTYVPVDM